MTGLRGLREVVGAALVSLAVAAAGAGTLSAQADGPTGTIAGTVLRSDGSGLGHAWIRYRFATDSTGHTRADELGRYQLRVPAGALHLTVEYIGHRPAEVEVVVPDSGSARVDIQLEEQPLTLPGIVVRTGRFQLSDPLSPLTLATPAPPNPDLEMATLTLDGGLAEVASAVGAAQDPNGDPPSNGSQVLLMRGSTADLKLLLLDGAPVYTPFHLAGLMDSFDSEVLGGAVHFVGAAPSRYDGGIDYILDLETRSPARDGKVHLRGALDLLSGGASAEWGGPAGGVLVSGRALHGGGPKLLEGIDAPYGYSDGLVRGAWTVGELNVGVTGFANRESVELGMDDSPSVPEQAMWSNQLFSVRAAHPLGPIDWSWTLAASRYDANLPLRSDSTETTGANPVLAEGATARLRATVDGWIPVAAGSLRFGLSADRTRANYGSSLRSEGGYTRTDARSSGHSLGAHAEWATPLSTSVRTRVGMRVDHFDPGGFRSALRGSVAWTVSPTAVLSLAAGRYHQFTRASDAVVEGSLTSLDGGSALDPALTVLEVALGDHLVVGLDQDLTPAVRLGLQGYLKRFADVEGTQGDRRSSGVDLRLRAGSALRTGWLGYSLSWTWADEPSSTTTGRFLGRHLLTAGYRGALVGPWGVEARMSFSDGLPLTEVPLSLDGAPVEGSDALDGEGARDLSLPTDADGFLRLDLELFGEWDAPVGGGRIRPYLKVMNALDRRDALFYYFEPWRSPDVTPLARRSILPVVGLAWRF